MSYWDEEKNKQNNPEATRKEGIEQEEVTLGMFSRMPAMPFWGNFNLLLCQGLIPAVWAAGDPQGGDVTSKRSRQVKEAEGAQWGQNDL